MDTTPDLQPLDPPPNQKPRTGIRWAIAVIGVAALAAVAVNYYMPWAKYNKPMPVATSNGAATGQAMCPADAKAANLDFTLKDITGADIALSQFKGKVILLDFWATWCGPCKIEIPWFAEFHNQYASKG